MRNIAVACTEDGRLSRHFRKSTHFQIFSVDGDEIRAITTARVTPVLADLGKGRREVSAAASDQEQQHGDRSGHGQHHAHEHLIGALQGCSMVLAGGMGEGVAGSLARGGIETIIAGGEYTPEEAVQAYLRGDLQTGRIHASRGRRHDHEGD